MVPIITIFRPKVEKTNFGRKIRCPCQHQMDSQGMGLQSHQRNSRTYR